MRSVLYHVILYCCAVIAFLHLPSLTCAEDPDSSDLCLDVVCDDGFSCTTEECVNGECVITGYNHNICDDGFGCTNDFCSPSTSDADETGCRHDYLDTRCNDGIACTDDICAPSEFTGKDGCLFTDNDEKCNDDNVCTTSYCSIEEEGCIVEANTSTCDDMDECTGTLEEPDQCGDGICSPGGLVCPLQTFQVYTLQHFYAGEVVVTNDDSNFFVTWNSNSDWVSKEFHMYISTEAPAKTAPAQFPHNFNLAQNVDSAEFVIPLPSDVGCNTKIFFAFHLVVDPNGKEICVGETCTTTTEKARTEGDKVPDKWHQWANYGDFTTCCCAGFSHVKQFGDHTAIDMTFVPTQDSRINEEELVQSLSLLLDHPRDAIIVISIAYDDGVERAVIGLLRAHRVSGSTVATVLMNTNNETFEEFGLSDISLHVVDDVNMDSYYYFYDSSESGSSALFVSLLLITSMLALIV